MNLAIVFPGQGSQAVGMLAELAKQYPEVKQCFSEASKIIGRNLWKLVQEGPKEELDQTVNTQPAMLAAGVGIWRAWRENGGDEPIFFAGHSLGEYTALVCAGALDFKDAVALVHERAQLMQEAVPAGEGGMAAILGLDDEDVVEACAQASGLGVVEAVNFNSPGQVVIAGEIDAVRQAIEVALEAGAKRAVELPVSVPSHSSLMEDAASKLAEKLSAIPMSKPAIPVVQNYHGECSEDADGVREALVRQLHSPVLWAQSVEYLAEQGVTMLLEFGPGKVLSGINKRVDKSLHVLCVQDPNSFEQALERCGEND